MNSLDAKIAEDLKLSIKEKKPLRTSTLRMVRAAIRNACIDKKEDSLKNEDVIKIISKQIKQRQDAIESFKKGGREDLAEKESEELDILKSYMPEEMPAEEIEKVIKKVVEETGSSSKSDFGKVMKEAMARLKGRADGKTVSGIAQRLLS